MSTRKIFSIKRKMRSIVEEKFNVKDQVMKFIDVFGEYHEN